MEKYVLVNTDSENARVHEYGVEINFTKQTKKQKKEMDKFKDENGRYHFVVIFNPDEETSYMALYDFIEDYIGIEYGDIEDFDIGSYTELGLEEDKK